MAKIDALPAIEQAEKVSDFLSGITGLPITAVQAFPELAALGDNSGDDNTFNFHLTLGNPGDSYKVRVDVNLKDEYTPGEWLPSVGWRISHNGRKVFRRNNYVNCSTAFGEGDLTNAAKIGEYLAQELRSVTGGPSTEVPFMDFESYTVESLAGKDSFFSTIYLAVMAHAKKRGLPMPPILSKRPEITRPMSLGDTETVNKTLAAAILFEGSSLDARCLAHMNYEAEVIRSHAGWEKRKRDPTVDLSEVFPYLETQTVKKGTIAARPRTILVVENDLHRPRQFTRQVVDGLENDGRYNGTRVIREVNLSLCMQLCQTGKIGMVLFDWSRPSPEEVLMVRGKRNPWFNLVHGEIQGILELDDDGVEIGLPDGRVLSEGDLATEAEGLDIRSRWAEMIEDACRNSQVEPPPHFIVRNREEIRDLPKILSQKLKK